MDVQNYFVTLCIRPAEMSGLKELPGATKDRITPLVLLAPWLGTTPLTRALEKFEEAYPARPYFVDVDTYYQINDNINEAKKAWQNIASKPADISTWHELLSSFPNSNPCLLMAEQTLDNVRKQISWARANDRTFCVRMNLAHGIGSEIPPWIKELITELVDEGATDYNIVFEFGWAPDLLILGATVSGYIDELLFDIPPTIPVVVSYTSFPRDFTRYDGIGECIFKNRDLVSQIQKTTNKKIVYGDWGSTRPRKYDRGSMPKNRIDYPSDTSWIIARGQENEISFKEAAKRIVNHEKWSGNLGVWGEQLIAGTADGQAFAIDTIPKMSAARINIHIHRQAFYDQLPPPEALDEKWSDDDL
jgi:hypothetical protein